MLPPEASYLHVFFGLDRRENEHNKQEIITHAPYGSSAGPAFVSVAAGRLLQTMYHRGSSVVYAALVCVNIKSKRWN